MPDSGGISTVMRKGFVIGESERAPMQLTENVTLTARVENPVRRTLSAVCWVMAKPGLSGYVGIRLRY